MERVLNVFGTMQTYLQVPGENWSKVLKDRKIDEERIQTVTQAFREATWKKLALVHQMEHLKQSIYGDWSHELVDFFLEALNTYPKTTV